MEGEVKERESRRLLEEGACLHVFGPNRLDCDGTDGSSRL